MITSKNEKEKRVIFAPVAGIVEATLMQPFDTIKVLKQSNQYPGLYNIYKQNRIKNLYKGLTPFMGQMFVKYGLRFSTFEYIRGNNNTLMSNFIAGVGAGVIESLFITPFELIKTNLQTRNSLTDPFTATKRIVNNKGFTGFFRGFTSTALRQSINQGSNFTAYMFMRDKFIIKNEKPDILKVMGSALISGSIGPLLNNPFDVIKTRYMNPKYNYNSIYTASQEIIKKEGYPALWKGIHLRLFRVAGGQAITFCTIEQLIYYTKHI